MREKSDTVCIQESCIKASLDFVLYAVLYYICSSQMLERWEGSGCATFVKQTMYRK